jgi:hypothetical protein
MTTPLNVAEAAVLADPGPALDLDGEADGIVQAILDARAAGSTPEAARAELVRRLHAVAGLGYDLGRKAGLLQARAIMLEVFQVDRPKAEGGAA